MIPIRYTYEHIREMPRYFIKKKLICIYFFFISFTIFLKLKIFVCTYMAHTLRMCEVAEIQLDMLHVTFNTHIQIHIQLQSRYFRVDA